MLYTLFRERNVYIVPCMLYVVYTAHTNCNWKLFDQHLWLECTEIILRTNSGQGMAFHWHCASFWSLEHFYEWLIMFTWVPCRCSKGFHFFAESEPRRGVAAAIVVAGRISELCRNFHCYTPGFYVIQWSIHPAFIRLQCYTVKYISGFSPVTVLL